MTIRKLRAARVNTTTASTFVGQVGDIFYDEHTGQLKVSDGRTAGGSFIPLVIATPTTAGAIKAGPGANVSIDGTLTIDTSGLPLDIGDLAIVQANISTVNANENLNLISNGTGAVNIVGNLHVHTTSQGPDYPTPILEANNTGNVIVNGTLINNGPTYNNGLLFQNGNITVSGNTIQTGAATFIVAGTPVSAALEITGNTSGLYQTPVNTGVGLQVTGADGGSTVSRIYNDSIGQYALFAGRRFNGTIIAPTQVLANQDIVRYAGTGYATGGWPTIGPARMVITASENLTSTNQGGRIEFWATANGTVASTSIQRVATIDPALGVTATGFYTTGNITAGNVVANTIGTLYGNVSGTILTASQPNVTSLGTLTGLTVDGTGLVMQGNVRYDVASANGTVTQLTDKSTAVTCNGRTGQITTSASSLAKGAAVTFTVNNSYVSAVTDVPVVVFQSGATTNSYAVSVTRVQVGSFNITITNNGTGPLTDTIIINFAIIKVS